MLEANLLKKQTEAHTHRYTQTNLISRKAELRPQEGRGFLSSLACRSGRIAEILHRSSRLSDERLSI